MAQLGKRVVVGLTALGILTAPVAAFAAAADPPVKKTGACTAIRLGQIHGTDVGGQAVSPATAEYQGPACDRGVDNDIRFLLPGANRFVVYVDEVKAKGTPATAVFDGLGWLNQKVNIRKDGDRFTTGVVRAPIGHATARHVLDVTVFDKDGKKLATARYRTADRDLPLPPAVA